MRSVIFAFTLAPLLACRPTTIPLDDDEGLVDGVIGDDECDADPVAVEVWSVPEDGGCADQSTLGEVEEQLEAWAVANGGFGGAIEEGSYAITANSGACTGCAEVSVTVGQTATVTLDMWLSDIDRAPYLYLYPEQPTGVRVRLPRPDRLALAEPAYPVGGWDVLAEPDGLLHTAEGPYDFLFYELFLDPATFQYGAGWCAEGEQAQATIEDAMVDWGFLAAEVDDFAGFWDPVFPDSTAVTIYPQVGELYPLGIVPAPDHVLRVNFVVAPGCQAVVAPLIEQVPREGFHAAEWGVVLQGGLGPEELVPTWR